MKTSKVSEATGDILDYLVAVAQGATVVEKHHGDFQGFYVVIASDLFSKVGRSYSPSSRWNQGGPIIEQENIKLFPNVGGTWSAQIRHEEDHQLVSHKVLAGWSRGSGSTPLIAACRCFCASKLGEYAEVPEELG